MYKQYDTMRLPWDNLKNYIKFLAEFYDTKLTLNSPLASTYVMTPCLWETSDTKPEAL